MSRDPLDWPLFRPFHFFVHMVMVFFFSLVALALLDGMVLQARIPLFAGRENVAAVDVALRCMDWHAPEPFYLFGGYEAIVSTVELAWQRDKKESGMWAGAARQVGDRDWVIQVGRHEYRGTTAHTSIEPRELKHARLALAKLYPERDGPGVLKWGEALFARWWEKQFWAFGARAPRIAPPLGTDEEHAWFAWQRLTGGDESVGDELQQLPHLLRKAYPEPADREAALEWAQTYYSRQSDNYRRWLARKRPPGRVLVDFWLGEVAMPPPTPTSHAWLLYQFVGLSERSCQAARERWLRLFPGKTDEALSWGAKLESARRDAGEPLPPPSENVALVCVIERITGTDAYGETCRRTAAQVLEDASKGPSLASDALLPMFIAGAYPADDFFHLQAVGDPLELVAFTGSELRAPDKERVKSIAMLCALAALLLLYLRTFLLDIVGAMLFGLRNNQRFWRYCQMQSDMSWRGLALSYLATPIALWLVTCLTLKPPLLVLTPTYFHLLLGAFVAVVFGGAMVLAVNRLVAITLIRFGWQIDKTWLDEIIGAALSMPTLWFFGNDLFSLIAFAFAAIAPEVLTRRRYRARFAEIDAGIAGGDVPQSEEIHDPWFFARSGAGAWAGLILFFFCALFVVST